MASNKNIKGTIYTNPSSTPCSQQDRFLECLDSTAIASKAKYSSFMHTAAGSAVKLQSLSSSSSSSNLSTSKLKHGSPTKFISHSASQVVISKSSDALEIHKKSSLSMSPSTISLCPTKPTASSRKSDLLQANAQPSSTTMKPKRKRQKAVGDKLISKLHLHQMHTLASSADPHKSSSSTSLLGAVGSESGIVVGYATTTTSTSDSCSGCGRKASTSSSSTGSCTNLTSQCETSSLLLSDTTAENKPTPPALASSQTGVLRKEGNDLTEDDV